MTLRARSLAIWKAVTSVIGPDEIQFWLGLILVAAGFWSFWRPGSYLVPGVVLVWSSLPSRAPLVARPDVVAVGREQRKRVV